ncbi:MAG: type II toxin-antitoxin system Phd/YefM family antitoxin [Devosia sp.]
MNQIFQRMEANQLASVSDLKKSPTAVLKGADGMPIAILNHNRVVAYLVPAPAYEELMDRLEDFELNAIADEREKQPIVKVALDEL